MLIAVILGGAVCPEPILKVQIWLIIFSRSMYEKTTCPKIDFCRWFLCIRPEFVDNSTFTYYAVDSPAYLLSPFTLHAAMAAS